MGAPSIDLAPELSALPDRLRLATLFAINKALTGSSDRPLLESFQRRNPELFGIVLPRAIAAGLSVLEIRDEKSASIAFERAALSIRPFRLRPDETELLTQLLRYAFAKPEPLIAMLTNRENEADWLSDADLEALGATPSIKGR